MRRSILSRPPVEDLARRLGLFAPLARSIPSRSPVEDLARRLGLFAPLARSIPSRSPVEDLARRLGLFAPLALIGGRPPRSRTPRSTVAAWTTWATAG